MVNMHEDYEYIRIDFEELKPIFSVDYSNALKLLIKIDKTKKQKDKDAFIGQFIYLAKKILNELRNKK